MVKTYLAIFAGLGLVMALVADFFQDRERRKPGPAAIEPGSHFAASSLFLTTVTVAALDIGRFHWTHGLAETMQILALVVFAFAASIQVWAMAVNPFFSTVIRLQTDRGHRLATRGPYRFIRHPGYLAMAIIMPATAIALGSVLALVPGLCYSALILWRANREDGFLTEQLAGYSAYAERVRYRLIPSLW
ncbi:MAG: methyltransferase family protein [Terriglobia bacterium]